MLKTLEHHEHAEHMAHAAEHGHGHGGGESPKRKLPQSQLAALLVATLAAGLALAEQGAKHAEIRVQANLIAATDAWAQYQAKSIRDNVSKDVGLLIGALDPTTNADVADRRKAVLATLKDDQNRFLNDPKDGKDAIAKRAHAFEEERDHALEQTHAYHNGAAAMELGIVLSTASAIIGSRALIIMALAIGLAGVFFAVAGYVAPEWGVL
jgi:hypothetical protein